MRSLRDASALAEHQLEAVERLEQIIQHSGGAILADEPGLGKSFVAAELARREGLRGGKIDVVVPASLIRQWERTLRRFAVPHTLMTHDRLLTDPFVPQPGRRLIVVDEAHAFRNPGTQRYAALARRSAGARLLLVTATPVCNSAKDIEALVRLIAADDALAGNGVPSIDIAFAERDGQAIRSVLDELLVRRGRDVLPPALQFGTLRRRVVRAPVFRAGGEIDRLIGALSFPLVAEGPLLRQFLWRRLESSEAALLESIRRQRRFYERVLECLAAGRALPKRDYRRAFAHEEDADAVQAVLFWEMFVPEADAADAAVIHHEMELLDGLRAAVESSPRQKMQKLVAICAASTEPLLVFTGWAATAIEIHRAVAPVRRAALVTGRERLRAESAIEDFTNGRADVLVSTDLAAEGLNLQRAAVVIHYDIPWNPVKVDQRNGRAHRIGQRRPEVEAIYFIGSDDPATVLHKVAAKNRVRRRLMNGERGQSSRHESEERAGIAGAPLLPRVASDAAIIRFAAAVERAGWRVPPAFERRHKAGVEELLRALAVELIDERKLRDLEDLVAFEPWGRSRPLRFAPI